MRDRCRCDEKSDTTSKTILFRFESHMLKNYNMHLKLQTSSAQLYVINPTM